MVDASGRSSFVVSSGATIRLRISGRLPAPEFQPGLCVAVSIKTLAGIDLIVGVSDPLEETPYNLVAHSGPSSNSKTFSPVTAT